MIDLVQECSRVAMSAAEQVLKKHLESFLKSREPPKTFCPSEVARALDEDDLSRLGLSHWREAMTAIRELAWEYRLDGCCEILQKGHLIPDDITLEGIKGPIRIRRKSV